MHTEQAQIIATEIIDLYIQHGGAEYAGEKVTQLEHMVQAAELAEQQGHDEEVILAAFLHDIGHICVSAEGHNEMDGFGIKDHEEVGGEFLTSKGFSKRLIRLVEAHVQAKRYLTWKSPAYYQQLSAASKKTLEYQGGRMGDEEARAFEQYPLFQLIIDMRYWDEEAKVEGLPVPDLSKYHGMIVRHLTRNNTVMTSTQLVVFDIAGTTVRDKGSVADAFMAAANEYGVHVPREEVNKVMGFRKKEAIRLLLDKFYKDQHEDTEALIEKIHDAFTYHMISFYEQDKELAPLPHVEETFTWLKQQGIKIALNTGFTRAITDTILRRLEWDKSDHIDCVICSDEVPQGRPYPFMIQHIMRQLQVADTKHVVKVGDTEVDVEEGRNAGCGLVVSVTTGAYTRSQLEQYHPDKIIDSLEELQPLIP